MSGFQGTENDDEITVGVDGDPREGANRHYNGLISTGNRDDIIRSGVLSD